MLEEKLQIFERSDGPTAISSYVGVGSGGINKKVPDYIYRFVRVEYNDNNCEILNTSDFNNVRAGGPLTRPTEQRPIVNIRGGIIRCFISVDTNVTPTGIIYYKIPDKVNWTYVVINKQAMYNANASTGHFELHPSEENQLINKILRLSGIAIQQPDLMKAGQGMEMMTIKQQPKI
jgi:hypothetical protein